MSSVTQFLQVIAAVNTFSLTFTFSQLTLLFFLYSFLGFAAETIIVTLNHRDYRGRGYLSAPFSYVYGIAAICMTLLCTPLADSPFTLYVACTVVAAAVQLLTAVFLSAAGKKPWWDYSEKPCNWRGILCLHYNLLWGVFGLIAVAWMNGFFFFVFLFLPGILLKAITVILLLAAFVDLAGLAAVRSPESGNAALDLLRPWKEKQAAVTGSMAERLALLIHKRFARNASESDAEGPYNPEHLKYREVLWIFLISSFLGCIVETIFCRLVLGEWMSRSSLVYGSFSVIWGISILLGTFALRKSVRRSAFYLFAVGTIAGLLFEYVLSFIGEIAFGVTFWDYNHLPLNIGGRVSLVFSFFWGIAAVIWIKLLYLPVSRFISFLLRKTGKWLSVVALVLLVFDLTVSYMALQRYHERKTETVQSTVIGKWLDRSFPDSKIMTIYPSAK